MQQKLQVKVEEMMDEFSKQWQPVMENLEVAEQAFDDVEGPPQCQPFGQLPQHRHDMRLTCDLHFGAVFVAQPGICAAGCASLPSPVRSIFSPALHVLSMLWQIPHRNG